MHWDRPDYTTQAVSGTITAEDILQLAHALKDEYRASELERERIEAFRVDGNARALAAMGLVYELKFGTSTDAPQWLCSVKTYNRVRYYVHLSKLPMPTRMLRKCHLRKRSAYRKRARRRYGL